MSSSTCRTVSMEVNVSIGILVYAETGKRGRNWRLISSTVCMYVSVLNGPPPLPGSPR